jgi:hypothetical protein
MSTKTRRLRFVCFMYFSDNEFVSVSAAFAMRISFLRVTLIQMIRAFKPAKKGKL